MEVWPREHPQASDERTRCAEDAVGPQQEEYPLLDPGIRCEARSHSLDEQASSMSDLLRTLESIRLDLAGVRGDVGTLRAEAATRHMATIQRLDGLSECLTLINTRVAGMESKCQDVGVSTAVGSVGEIARTAILGQ
jgi:hypothetical protein